jgi:hypothetical protein
VDRNTLTILLIVGLVVAGTAGGMAYIDAKSSREQPVRAPGQDPLIDRGRVQRALIEEQVVISKGKVAARRVLTDDEAGCFDSDATHGADAIYVLGSVQVGGGTSFDHCRRGQLVEFSCVASADGSGRLVPDGKTVDCLSGSSCVDGACVH